MKRLFFTSFVICLALSSCISEDQKKAEQTKETAVNFIKAQLDCPSTMKVVAVKQEHHEKYAIDTLCHIKDIKGESKKVYGENTWTKIDAFIIDSLCTNTRSYPAHTICSVTYDASNLFGVMVREESYVVVTDEGQVYSYDDFYENNQSVPLQKKWAVELITVPIKKGDLDFMDYRINCWVHSSHFPYSFK